MTQRAWLGHGVLTLAAVLGIGACADSPADPFAEACAGNTPFNLAVGEVAEPSPLVDGGVCLQSTEPADYVVVVTTGDAGEALERHEVDILGSGFRRGSASVLTAAYSSISGQVGGASGAPRAHDGSPDGSTPPDVVRPALATHELDLRIRPGARVGPAGPIASRSGTAGTPAVRTRSVPAVGGVREYPTAVSCDVNPDVRRGRVVAVTDHSVVVIDEEAPSPGFSDADLAGLGAFFDDSVYGLLTGLMGEPSDIDQNGRVVLFFTPAANALSSGRSAGVVGGYFWGGDLFPRVDEPESGLAGCAASAEGEILYMSVPDPDGVVATPIRADQLQTRAVLAHELQHLLNAARRLHVNSAEVLEETWLNEGLSYVAEELIFHQTAGVPPGEDLDGAALEERGLVEAFNDFAYGNIGRYNVFLQAPHSHSLMGPDGIETRGATWSFLRYLLDRSPGPDAEILRSLLNSTTRGVESLAGAFGVNPLDRMGEWAVTMVTDDLAGADDPRFQQPSWRFPSLIASLRADRRYPLQIVGVPPDQGVRFTLRTGGAGFGSLRLEPFGTAHVEVRAASEARVRAFLVRVR